MPGMPRAFTFRFKPQRLNEAYSEPHNTPETEKGDITQRFEKRLAEYNASGSIFRRWHFEILTWLLSASCLGAIAVIYAVIRDRPLADLGDLLTFTNMLGKVTTAALIIPTTEALGQLKWNWFSTSNAIWDFEIFDKATRGPRGAAMLLYRTKGRSLASLGAVLVLLLLAVDAFLQKLVDLPERSVLHQEPGMVRRMVQYEPNIGKTFTEGRLIAVPDKDLNLVASIFFYANGTNAIAAGNRTRPEVPVVS
jgi:hypothetical protein